MYDSFVVMETFLHGQKYLDLFFGNDFSSIIDFYKKTTPNYEINMIYMANSLENIDFSFYKYENFNCFGIFFEPLNNEHCITLIGCVGYNK